MKSEGRGKGYQCRKCGQKSMTAVGEMAPQSAVCPGTYLPSPRAQRHLTKQLIRYGNESVGRQAVVKGWMASGASAS